MESGLSTLGHNLGRWDLGVQAQKPGLALPVLEQGSWGRGKGSISILGVSCLLREVFSVDGSMLCIAPRQNRAPAQHGLSLGSFPRSSQEQSVALQRCSCCSELFPKGFGGRALCTDTEGTLSALARRSKWPRCNKQLFSGVATLKWSTYSRCSHNANCTEELFMTGRALSDLDPLQSLLVSSFSHAPRPW